MAASEHELKRLASALTPNSQLLYLAPGKRPRFELVGDWDCCFLDNSPLEALETWRCILETGRLAEVEGAFALAGTAPDGAVFLARDAIGERSLYYTVVRGGLAFASNLRALVATGLLSPSLSVQGLLAYLSYGYVPGRGTLVESVYEVLPGEIVSFRAGRLDRTTFWKAPGEDPLRTEEDSTNELRVLLEQAVQRRLPTSGHVAASLSGGIDSSAVVALARSLHEGPLLTYSLSFGHRYPNELAYSNLVAGYCRAENRVLEVSVTTVMERLDEVMGLLSKPIGEPLTVPNLLLFREAAADGVQGLLNGEGGDPCFGGPKNAPMLLWELYGGGSQDPQPHRRERMYLRAHRKCYSDLGAMLHDTVLERLAEEPLELMLSDALADPRWPSLIGRLMALNVRFKGAHHILSKVDHLSAACGILPRSPLFDRAVVEAALRMPPRLRFTGAVEKYAFKRAVQDLVPAEVIHRPKSGMRVPVHEWLEGRFARFARERILGGLIPYGILRDEYLRDLVATNRSTFRPGRAGQVWLLLSLEAWLRTVLDQRA